MGLGIAWIVVTAFLARQQAAELSNRLHTVRIALAEGRYSDAREVASDIPAIARRARDLTSGPAWWTAAHVPVIGAPLEVARGATAAGDQVAGSIPQLMRVVLDLDPASLRVSGDTVRLAPLIRAAPTLRAAAASVDAAARTLTKLPTNTWLGVMDRGRARYAADVTIIRGYVDPAARVASALPTMLGRDGPKTYFIGLQNEAELRGTGGLPGAFAIARADRGRLTFLRFESDAALEPPRRKDHAIRTGLSFGPGYESAYGRSLPTSTFVDSNVSPHFPYAARIWQAMWERTSGQRVDGVMALDPTVLAYFLSVTGPAQLPGGRVISAQNVVSLTQRDEYALFSDNARRKQFIVDVLRAASRKLTSGEGSALGILRAASRAGLERRLLAWSDDPAVEHVLEASQFAGALPRNRRPFGALIVNNAAAGKLDYYLDRSITYERTGCGSTRDVIVTIKLTNNAPARGLSPYVVTRFDKPPPGARPGDSHVIIDYYAHGGAKLQSATLNGHPGTAAIERDLGHVIFRLDLELPRRRTQTWTLHLSEPAGRGTPELWRQPGVNPLDVQVYDQKC